MRSVPLFLAAITLALGCSGDTTAPGGGSGDGARLASQFDALADSVDAGGYSPAGEALRHAGEIARLTGHATPVVVTIDGVARSFLSVAEQIDFPNLVCTFPDSGVTTPPDTIGVPPPDTVGALPPDSMGGHPIDSTGMTTPDSIHIPVDSGIIHPPPGPPECKAQGTYSMRTLIAWEPEHLNEVVRIVAYIGSSTVEPGVPDVMAGLPDGKSAASPPPSRPDSGSGSGGEPGGFPGFMGEYLVRNVGSWLAVEGSQSNDLVRSVGDCTSSSAAFDWAQFDCTAARFRFEFSMGVDPLRYGPLTGVADPPGAPEGHHTLAMSSTELDGVRLTWKAWTPPPFRPDSVPTDSGTTRPTVSLKL
jgi:hypothetical protein